MKIYLFKRNGDSQISTSFVVKNYMYKNWFIFREFIQKKYSENLEPFYLQDNFFNFTGTGLRL